MEKPDNQHPGLTISYLADCPQHANTLAVWSFDEWGHYFPEDTQDSFKRDYQVYLTRDRIPLAVVAHVGGRVVGGACLFSNDDLPGFDHLTPWLGAVYVAAEHRRQGIGQALVGRIVAEAKRLGHGKIYLWTGSEGVWYAKQGWKKIAETTFFGQAIDVMELGLE
jgi:GNAT superfamily N-acetyltransferase